MTRLCVAAVLIAFVCGCQESLPPPTVPNSGSSEPNSSQTDQQTSNTNSEQQQFSQDLSHLTEIAQQKEAAGQFAEAARVWGQVNQLAASRFGTDAWQVTNASVAYRRAFMKSQFSKSQLQDLSRSEQLIEQVLQNYENNDIAAASTNARKTIEIYVRLFGEDSVEVGQMLVQLATFESSLNQLEPAIRHFHQAVAILKEKGFSDHPELERAHGGLAMTYLGKGSLAPAIGNQKEATRIAGTIWGQQSLAFAKQAHQLGILYHQAKNLEVAFEILTEAKLIRQKELGTDNPAFAHSCLNLGVVSMDQRKFEQAKEYFDKALGVLRDHSDENDPNLVRCKSHLATIYMLQQKPQLAEPLLQSIVDSLEKCPAAQSPFERLDHVYRLSIALARQGKYGVAKPILERLISEQKAHLGISDRRTVSSLKAYALLLERTNQLEAAETIRRQINQIASRSDSNEFQSLR